MTPFRIAFAAACIACAGASPAGAQPKESAPALEFYLEGKWREGSGHQWVTRIWRSAQFTRWESEDEKQAGGAFVRRDAKSHFYIYMQNRGVFRMLEATPDLVRHVRSVRPTGTARWTRIGKATVVGQPVTQWHVDGAWYYDYAKPKNVVCHYWITDSGIELRFHCNDKAGTLASKISFEATKLEIGTVNPRHFTFINEFRDLGKIRP